MIILTTTTLKLVLAASSVLPLTVVGSYVDLSDSTYSPNPFTSASSGTTPVTILAAPDVNYSRQVKFLSINNPNVLVASLTLSHGTTQLIHIDLAAGSTLLYTDGRGFSVMDATGQTITAAGTSTLGGGSGIVSYTVGDLLYASTTTALAKLSDVAVGSVLASGGVGVAPAWSATPNLTAASFGANPATTGTVRLPNNADIYFRDSAGTGNVRALNFATDNLVYFFTSVRPGTDAALNFGDPSFRWATGYFAALTVSNAINLIDANKRIFATGNDIWIQSALGSIVHGVDNGGSIGSAALRWATGYFATSLSVGTTFPLQGTIRLGNGGSIFSRNDANSADAKVLDFSSATANTLTIGDSSFATRMIGSSITTVNDINAGANINFNSGSLLSNNANSVLQIGGGITLSGGAGGGAPAAAITKYHNVTTAGWGVPAIYSSGRVTAQTAANASIATYTVGAADGSFEVSGVVTVTTSTTHSFSMTCAYTDETNASRTFTLNFVNTAGAFFTTFTNAGGASAYNGIPMHFRAKAATVITMATTGTFTTVTYNAEGSIRQIA